MSASRTTNARARILSGHECSILNGKAGACLLHAKLVAGGLMSLQTDCVPLIGAGFRLSNKTAGITGGVDALFLNQHAVFRYLLAELFFGGIGGVV
jgi:hypothetical protein